MIMNFYLTSMFITPEQAMELCQLNIDQSKSMFYWGRVQYRGNNGWALFLIKDQNEPSQYLCGDKLVETLYADGEDVGGLVDEYYAAFNLSQLMQILQNEIMNLNITREDKVNMSFCHRDYQYFELAEGCCEFLIGLIKDEQFNDDQCNGTLEIY